MANFNTNPIPNSTNLNIIDQILDQTSGTIVDYYNGTISSDALYAIVRKLAQKQNQLLDQEPVELINYQENLIINPSVNPLISAYLIYDGYNIMIRDSPGITWSELQSWEYYNHTPSTGINLHTWALKPLQFQPTGSSNLSRITKFESVYNVHRLIGDNYPASLMVIVQNLNLIRFLGGMCGKAW